MVLWSRPPNPPARLLAYSEGDEQYRYTEQVGMMPRGFKGFTKGKPQRITFPPVGTLRADHGPVELRATSNAGLAASYHIAYGPAVVKQGRLKISQIPARAVFPLRVKIVAYQFGSGLDPECKPPLRLNRSSP